MKLQEKSNRQMVQILPLITTITVEKFYVESHNPVTTRTLTGVQDRITSPGRKYREMKTVFDIIGSMFLIGIHLLSMNILTVVIMDTTQKGDPCLE